MIEFIVRKERCTQCGSCAADCPARIIDMEGGYPAIAPQREENCYRCQHCLAVCPGAAVSILGLRPEESRPLSGALPDPFELETLIMGRRSVRRYRDENLEPELVQRLLNAACHAPSGMNTRQLQFTVVDDRTKLAGLRDELMAELERLVEEGRLPEGLEFIAGFIKLWTEEKEDFLFRGAPHLLLVSAPSEVVSPLQDCLIALSYFELLAQSMGVGTVWDGLAKLTLNDLLPHYRKRLGIPENHLVGYAMAFGRPAVSYARTAQHGPARIHLVP